MFPQINFPEEVVFFWSGRDWDNKKTDPKKTEQKVNYLPSCSEILKDL